MNIRRRLLYASYALLRKTPYFRLKNRNLYAANILMFHRVNNSIHDSLTIDTHFFESLMREIGENYIPISLGNLIDTIKHGGTIKPGTVVITFDDGYRDNFTMAAPILKNYGIPATFFITSGYINTKRNFPWDANTPGDHSLMDWDEIRELRRMGFEVGAHTVNHVNLGKVPLSQAQEEIIGSKEQIERETGGEISLFAYPFGGKDCIRDEVRGIIRENGFACCCSGYGGKVTGRSDLFNLYRIPSYPNLIETLMELDNFMTYFDGTMSFQSNCSLKYAGFLPFLGDYATGICNITNL